MGEISILLGSRDIADAKEVELGLSITASGIDGEQDRPGDAAADEADDSDDLKEAQEQVAVERVMVQDVGVGDLPESRDPGEKALGKLGRAFLLAKRAHMRPRSILARNSAAQEQEDTDIDAGKDQDWNESRDQAGRGRRRTLGAADIAVVTLVLHLVRTLVHTIASC